MRAALWCGDGGGEWVRVSGRFTSGMLGAIRFTQTLPGGTERNFKSTSPNVWDLVMVGGVDELDPLGLR